MDMPLFCLLQWKAATNSNHENPSKKISIANGFVIGLFPQEIQFSNKDNKRVTRNFEDYELTDLLMAMVAPIRPYGCVFCLFWRCPEIDVRELPVF
jgi:hypothetical protein